MLPEIEAKTILESEKGGEIGIFTTWKRIAAHLISFSLFITALYQIGTALIEIISLLPYQSQPFSPVASPLELIQKALLITAAGFLDIFYAFILYVKPSTALKKAHLAAGLLLLIGSLLVFQLNR